MVSAANNSAGHRRPDDPAEAPPGLSEAIPNSELRIIADGPHGCHISHPAEFNAALLEFLAR
nr:alpha/beta hydrolase [Mycobacterium mantenii]